MTRQITFTAEQRQAIETIDRSVLVSAAAGSGKTAVLAERCAHLVCDAPAETRCDIDELAVVTFTENAAAEMKTRVRAAIHARLTQQPRDARLREQLALVDHARISTLHSFGLWILRRWFSHADIDPAAPLLDAHEAAMLRNETLDRLFEELYENEGKAGTELRGLVDDYGLGDDKAIREFIAQLAGFLESLPDPAAWLARGCDLVTTQRDELLSQHSADLIEELEGQTDYCNQAASHIERRLPDFAFYASKLREAAVTLTHWHGELTSKTEVDAAVRVQAAIAETKFSARGAPRLAKDAPESVRAQRDLAKQLLSHFQDKLFKSRLLRGFGRFTAQEWVNGLERIAPYVQIVTRIVERYREAYAQAKSDAGVLDFWDLERRTYDLLREHPEIAAALRNRFRHVLVDEFQDINPIQESIIRLASREANAELVDNLFVVGDVKQSIYRFRLAEPDIFLDRQHKLGDAASSGTCIHLQHNFRSAPHIIDAVNHLFRRLLTRHVGGIEYDESAELRCGVATDSTAVEPSVELHLLQRRMKPDENDTAEYVDQHDPAEWSVIEREAYVIASRIRTLVNSGETKPGGSLLGYGDIAVLLRAATHNAAPLAAMLGSLGIPACADVGGEFFDTLEVRDVLALLNVLDNMRQDIPLAAVLRGPMLGDPLNEDELLALRAIDNDIPFHEAVSRYVEFGPDERLRERLARLLGRIERYRTAAREHPLAEALWVVYHKHGYLAHIGGLPNGAGRRANLLRLHEYARAFGTFQRQGLHRFLRFLESIQAMGQDLGAAPLPTAPESVVRVMSIHRSKGLEFPVVVLADLGHRFNLSDVSGRLIFDRHLGFGLRVVDEAKMIEYPSLAHHLVASRVNRHTRAEELRVLYVALTRAERRLIMVGSAELSGLRRAYDLHIGAGESLSRLAISMATTPLDWILPALATLPPDMVRWSDAADRDPHDPRQRSPIADGSLFDVFTYDEDEMSGWNLEVSASTSEKSARRAVSQLGPLPADEPLGDPDETVKAVLERTEYIYPHLAAASVPAVVAATELRKRYDWLTEPAAPPPRPRFDPPEPVRLPSDLSAAESGIITHRFLQHLDLLVSPAAEKLAAELDRQIKAGLLPHAAAEAVDLPAVEWFLGTELGNRIRRRGAEYRREVMFVHRRPDSVVDPLVAGASGVESAEGDTVLVRGVIDGILPGESGVEIADYKTDRIEAADVDERVRKYLPQLAAYAAAGEALFGRPADKWWLVFLHPHVVVDARTRC